MAFEVFQFPCLSDNYGYLLHDADSGATACIDTPEAEAINAALEDKGWRLTHILNTHHHFDHAGEVNWFVGMFVQDKGAEREVPAMFGTVFVAFATDNERTSINAFEFVNFEDEL